MQGGDGEFDVFDYFYFGLGELVNADALVDLTEWIGANSEIATDDFLPSIYDPYTLIDGKRYGLPFDGDTHVLYYNAEVFEKYGVEPPKTWDEYDAAAEKITKDSGGSVYGAIVEGQQVPMILGCSFINRLAGYGGTLVDSDGKPAFAGGGGPRALQHLIDVSPSALPTPLQTGFDQANSAFLSGQGAMLDTWTDLGLKAQDPSSSKIVDKWGVVTLPVGGKNTTPRTALDAGFGLGVQRVQAAGQGRGVRGVGDEQGEQPPPRLHRRLGHRPGPQVRLDADSYAQAAGKATDVIREGLDGTPLAWPSQQGAPRRCRTSSTSWPWPSRGRRSRRPRSTRPPRAGRRNSDDAARRTARGTDAGRGPEAPARLRRHTAGRPGPHRPGHVSTWLAAPSLAGLALMLVYPTLFVVALAVTKSSLARPLQRFTGTENFVDAWESLAFAGSLVRSVVFAVVAALAATLIGVLLALLLHARGTRFGVVGTILLLPLVTPPVMVGVAWKLMLAPVGGARSAGCSRAGVPRREPAG